jgi:23S rRNA (guanosine2251-2'-O)-methyltransferase
MAPRDRSSSRRGEKGGRPPKKGGRPPKPARGGGPPKRAGGPRGGGPPPRAERPGGPRGGGPPPRAERPGGPRSAGPPPRAERPGGPRSAGPRPERAAPEAPRPARDLVYGRNAVREALRGPRRVFAVHATEAAAKEGWQGAPLKRATAEELTTRCGTDAHQGVCADVEPFRYADATELLRREAPVLVALDEVTDPQNLGAVARSAECSGATGLIILERRSAEVTPAVCKASAGAVEHLPVARVRNLADFLAEAKEAGCWVYGTAAGARTSYDQPDYSGGVVLVLGAEGKGLRPRVASACDDLISLPMRGRIGSLNVSAAAAVVLYRILQNRLDTST